MCVPLMTIMKDRNWNKMNCWRFLHEKLSLNLSFCFAFIKKGIWNKTTIRTNLAKRSLQVISTKTIEEDKKKSFETLFIMLKNLIWEVKSWKKKNRSDKNKMQNDFHNKFYSIHYIDCFIYGSVFRVWTNHKNWYVLKILSVWIY